jgi:hypothetical protein
VLEHSRRRGEDTVVTGMVIRLCLVSTGRVETTLPGAFCRYMSSVALLSNTESALSLRYLSCDDDGYDSLSIIRHVEYIEMWAKEQQSKVESMRRKVM